VNVWASKIVYSKNPTAHRHASNIERVNIVNCISFYMYNFVLLFYFYHFKVHFATLVVDYTTLQLQR